MILRTLSVLLASAALALASTKSVYKVWQPLSLHGTDVDSVLGKESGVNYAVVLSTPVVLSGALPEDLVYAVGLKHKFSSIGGYSETEANLLILKNIKLEALYEDESLTITIDVSNAKNDKEVTVSLRDTVLLTVQALKKTLDDYGSAYLRGGMKCEILITGDKKDAQGADLQDLSTKFVVQTPNEGAVEAKE